MRGWLTRLWHDSLIRADELATRSSRAFRPVARGRAHGKTLQLDSLEPRILFSAAPLDPNMMPGGDDTDIVEVVQVDQAGTRQSLTENATIASTTSLVQAEPSEMVIIDPGVDDLERLLDDLHASDRHFAVFVLDGDRDGIDQITEILEGRTGIESLHLVSHGTEGGVQLGNTWLTESTLPGYAGQLALWNHALSSDADILLYGCELAGNASGQELVASLSALTGADVAASTNDTGHERLDGDWVLEFQVGSLESDVAFSTALQQSWIHTLVAGHYLDTFSVESYGNNDGTLTWASDWIETDSSGGGAANGWIKVEPSRGLKFKAATPSESIVRQVDLSAVTTAELSFDIDSELSVDSVRVEISSNGGGSWTTLAEYSTSFVATETFNITPYASANTQIRISSLTSGNDTVYFDNVRIDVDRPNANPLANAGGPYVISEGQALSLDASGSSDPELDTLSYSWDLDGDGLFDDATGVAPTVSWASLQGMTIPINDDGTYTVAVRVVDAFGGVATDSTTLTVNNVAPTLTVSGAGTVVEGATYSITLSAVDPGDDTITHWHVDWGDGTYETINTPFPATFDHAYATGGTFNILIAATDEDGTWVQNDLFVASHDPDGLVFHLEANTGSQLNQFGSTGSFNHPYGITVGPNGHLYVTSSGSGLIREFDADGTDLGIFASLNTPTGLAFDSAGHLWVAQYGNQKLTEFDTDGSTLRSINVGFRPTGIAFHPNGNLYLVGGNTDEVYEFDGVTVTSIANGLHNPEGIAVSPDGTLFVVDHGNNLIRVFDTAGTELDSFAVTDPYGATFGPDGRLYVSSYSGSSGNDADDRILRYSFDGISWVFEDEYSSGGRAGVALNSPSYMAFMPELQVAVTSEPDTPGVTDASTDEHTQTSVGLVITRNANDGNEVTHFKITGITGGTLFQNDGVTSISNGSFITVAEGNAGLKFTPSADFNDLIGTASFQVQSSLSASGGGLGGGLATATISISEINDAPERLAGTVANLTVNEDSGWTSLGLATLDYGPGGGGDEGGQTLTYTVTTLPSAALGSIYLADDSTLVTAGTYTLAQLRGMKFRPTDQAPGGPATFQWTVTDNGTTDAVADPQVLTESLTITVTPQPDVPILGGLSGSSIDDSQTVQPFVGATIQEVDGENVTVFITLSGGDANGQFTAGSLLASGFAKTGIGEYTLTSTTAAAAQAAIRQLIFDPTENEVAVGSTIVTTMTISVQDTVASVAMGAADVTVASVNDAPSIGAGVLAATVENDFDPPGASVSSLFNGSFTDADIDSTLSGIVIVENLANPITEGIWQYSSDGGTNWFAIGLVNDSRGLAVAADSLIRFVPFLTYSGSPTALGVRGLDDSYGGAFSTTSAGQTRVTIDTSTPTGDAAFSDPPTTLSTSVTNNGSPVIGGASANQSVDDDATLSPFAGLTINDPESDDVTVRVTLSGGDANGAFTAGSRAASGFTKTGAGEYSLASTTAAAAQAAIRALVFDPTENQVSVGASVVTTFTISVNDGNSTTNDAGSSVIAISINDAPTVGDGTLAPTSEGHLNPPGETVGNLVSGTFSDPDAGSGLRGIVLIHNPANPNNQGSWQYSSDGVNWFNVGNVNGNQGLVLDTSARIRFLPNASFNGAPPDLGFRGLDDTYGGGFSSTAAGETRVLQDTTPAPADAPFSSASAHIHTNVTDANDPPTLSDHTISMFAGGTLNASASIFQSLSFDEDGNALTAIQVTTTANGTLVVRADGSFTYKPSAGFNGSDSFQWRAFDGIDSSAAAMLTINVNPVIVIPPPAPNPAPDPTPEPPSDRKPDPDPEPDPEPDAESGTESGTESESEGESSSDPIPVGKNETPGTASGSPSGNPAPAVDNRDGNEGNDAGGSVVLNSGNEEIVKQEDDGLQSQLDAMAGTRGFDSQLMMQNAMLGVINQTDLTLMSRSGAMWDEMDSSRDLLNSRVQSDIIIVGAAGAAASSFTVGYVAWAIRSGFLLSGVLAQLPAWQAVDPLTVMQGLSSVRKNETLEQLMERKAKAMKSTAKR